MAKKTPSRMCVSCREMKPKKELIRLSASKDGIVSLDPGGRLPGRGAYVCRNRQCIENAVKGRRLDRGLKQALDGETIEQLLAEMEALDQDDS
ncbi:MAG: YlxR family protein [Clostridiaceae bacterium]|nr:YlxR family protein [Clostridiaceae bacterium]